MKQQEDYHLWDMTRIYFCYAFHHFDDNENKHNLSVCASTVVITSYSNNYITCLWIK